MGCRDYYGQCFFQKVYMLGSECDLSISSQGDQLMSGKKEGNVAGNFDENPEKGAHKVEYVYVCTCRLEYRSFPALYLHHKLKHGSILRSTFRESMTKKTLWKGLKKIVVFQFPEESGDELDECSEEQFKIGQITKKDKKDEESKTIERQILSLLKNFKVDQEDCVQGEYEMKGELKIFHVERVLKEVVTCFMTNFSVITSQLENPFQLNFANFIDLLPYSFNHFITCWVPCSHLSQLRVNLIEQLLLDLSNWLYTKKLSKHIALRNI